MTAHGPGNGVRKAVAPATEGVPRSNPTPGARHRHPRSDDANAFIPDPEGGPAHTDDDLAEGLAEGFVLGATQSDDDDEVTLGGVVPEELGGPFVETSGEVEFADGSDGSNPKDASREPIPRPTARLVQPPKVEEDEENG
jgi:hypothetical protein